MIRFLIIGSGSKGNATLVYDEKTLFQIDMGVPLCRITAGLEEIGKPFAGISALFLTHDHTDHIGTVPLLEKKVPIYASQGTYKTATHLFTPGDSFQLGSFSISSFAVSHDATNPVGYLIKNGSESLVYVTDTGYLSDEDLALMNDATYYIIESNHDYKMLLASHRPASLKHRIHSDVGHLSNSDSAHYVVDLVGKDTKGIYLAHLSEECNTPELALSAYTTVFAEKGINLRKIHLECAKQWEAVKGGDL
jgi:phosphoribosyl 1,2-cyclic phosphodiesterase